MANIDPIRDGQHYDVLKAQDDIPFYRTQAQQATGPVLEIGCGTGRVTLPIASDSVEITGVDVSAAHRFPATHPSRSLSVLGPSNAMIDC
jgi:2-polyprenyl-3-methyl-5-hydroxy-6-metoxy-1,4-benzoquinol methylase